MLPFDLLIFDSPVEPHDPRRPREARLRLEEHGPEAMVEPAHGLARELEVLELVVADGDDGGLVEEDVRAHEHRVREEADATCSLPLALLLELRHPLRGRPSA